MVEYLPNLYEALGLIPRTAKKRKKRLRKFHNNQGSTKYEKILVFTKMIREKFNFIIEIFWWECTKYIRLILLAEIQIL